MIRSGRLSCLLSTIVCLACGGSDDTPHPVEPLPPTPPPIDYPDEEEPPRPSVDHIQLLELETYDGSGQVVHPDVARTPERWARRSGHLVITPYPNGNAGDENPSVYLADNGLTWKIPRAGLNPIARPRSGGYLSDPDEVYDPMTRELLVYYRQVTSQNEIYLTRSRDASTWSDPVLVVNAPNHQIVSPSVVRRSSNDWLMWSVNAGDVGCGGKATTIELRRSQNGVQWSAPTTVSLDHGPISAWHINVEWIPSHREFWAVYNGKTEGSCTTPALYFAKSEDGISWTVYALRLLERGAIPAFQDIVYRSTFEYDPSSDEVTFWYSGARYENSRYEWRAAVQRVQREVLFAKLTPDPKLTRGSKMTQGRRAAATPRLETSAPPLTNATAP